MPMPWTASDTVGTILAPGLFNIYRDAVLEPEWEAENAASLPAAAEPVLSMPNPFNPYTPSPYEGPVDPLHPETMFYGVPKPAVNTPSDVVDYEETVPSDVKASIKEPGSWWEQMFETSEHAAVLQAQRNEEAAYSAYLRSEEAADNAYKRARNLRKTQYLDAVESLKAAGLNPVLAAQYGISGSSTTAPQANAPASSSSAASGIDGASLLVAIASILSSAGNLMKGISSFMPSHIVGEYSNTNESTIWNHIFKGR